VVFVGQLVEGTDPLATMYFGIGAGAIVLALAAFSFSTRSGRSSDKK